MIAILSDIHGNFSALKSVIRDIQELDIEVIISLGDVVGYYCGVNECIELLREKKVINIMGNHDYYLTSGTKCPRSRSANVCLDYQRAVISAENLDWLKMSVDKIERQEYLMVHGGLLDARDEYVNAFDAEYASKIAQAFFFAGHTHVQALLTAGGRTYVNPGSVGQPRDGLAGAAYAVFDGEMPVCRRVAYDVEETIGAMRSAGFPESFASNLRTGSRIGSMTGLER